MGTGQAQGNLQEAQEKQTWLYDWTAWQFQIGNRVLAHSQLFPKAYPRSGPDPFRSSGCMGP